MENAPSFITHSSTEAHSSEDLAMLAAALGHPHRVAILRYLIEHPGCICGDIVNELPVAQSTVSQHLKKLKEAGWIQGEISGPKTCYCLKPGVLNRFRELVVGLLEERQRGNKQTASL